MKTDMSAFAYQDSQENTVKRIMMTVPPFPAFMVACAAMELMISDVTAMALGKSMIDFFSFLHV